MSEETPKVQPTSDRLNVRRGRTVEVVFPKGVGGHYENLTPEDALALSDLLADYVRRAHPEALREG